MKKLTKIASVLFAMLIVAACLPGCSNANQSKEESKVSAPSTSVASIAQEESKEESSESSVESSKETSKENSTTSSRETSKEESKESSIEQSEELSEETSDISSNETSPVDESDQSQAEDFDDESYVEVHPKSIQSISEKKFSQTVNRLIETKHPIKIIYSFNSIEKKVLIDGQYPASNFTQDTVLIPLEDDLWCTVSSSFFNDLGPFSY